MPDKPEYISPQKAEPELVFYYSREKRLEKASDAVRRINDPAPLKPPGIFRTLVATKGRAALFFSIIVISAAILFISVLDTADGGSFTIGGNAVTVSALRYEQSTFIVIKKTARQEGAYTGIVDAGISIPLSAEEEKQGARSPVELARLVFTGEPEEDFRLSVPLNAEELLIMLRAGEERVSRRIKPE